MYWRIQKIDNQKIIKQVLIPVALVISVLLNGYFINTNSKKKSQLSQVQKESFASLAKNVTIHFLDTSYINYKQNTFALMHELAPSLIQKLRANEELPASDQQLEATYQEYLTKRRISALRIDNESQGDPDNNGFVPVDVSGVIVVSSADESDTSDPKPFHFRYLIGMIKIKAAEQTDTTDEPKRGHGGFNSLVSEPKQEDNLVPVVIDLQDLSQAAPSQGQGQ